MQHVVYRNCAAEKQIKLINVRPLLERKAVLRCDIITLYINFIPMPCGVFI